jgi:hypothetical protein
LARQFTAAGGYGRPRCDGINVDIDENTGDAIWCGAVVTVVVTAEWAEAIIGRSSYCVHNNDESVHEAEREGSAIPAGRRGRRFRDIASLR